jgi:transcriptional regulator with XRE-family HTH domain
MTRPPDDGPHRGVVSASAGELGAAVCEIRSERGISQSALARRAVIHRNAIRSIERGLGRNPSLLAVSRLAFGMGISVSVLTAAWVWPGGSEVALARLEGQSTLDTSDRVLPGGAGLPDGTGIGGLARAVYELRRARRLTPQTAAVLAQLRLDDLMRLEKGQVLRPGLLTLTRVAKALGERGHPDVGATDECLGLLAVVFAGELTVDTAMCRWREKHENQRIGASVGRPLP